MNPKALFLAALLAAASTQGISMAAEVSTEPVGVVSVTAPGMSDTRVATPMARASVYVGTVSEINGNELTLAGASFVPSQFVKSGSSQPNTYYVRVSNGTASGAWYTIVSNSASSVTISNPSSQTLSQQGLAAGTGIGKILIIPHWTLNTLLPSGGNVASSPNPFAPNGTLLLFNSAVTTGIDIAPDVIYFYHDGSSGVLSAGWYNIANIFGGQVGDVPIAPDEFFVVRNTSAQERKISLTGAIPTTKMATELLRTSGMNDNAVVQPFPVPVSLAQLKLAESGAFKATTNIFVPDGDLVLQYPVPSTGFDQTPTKVYLYYDGVAGVLPAGWYDLANLFGGAVTNTLLFSPGEGIIIRKRAGTDQISRWAAELPYSL